MPQMAPMSWLNLFIIFTMTFLLFNTMNYYCFNYSIKTIKKSSKKETLNWKW